MEDPSATRLRNAIYECLTKKWWNWITIHVLTERPRIFFITSMPEAEKHLKKIHVTTYSNWPCWKHDSAHGLDVVCWPGPRWTIWSPPHGCLPVSVCHLARNNSWQISWKGNTGGETWALDCFYDVLWNVVSSLENNRKNMLSSGQHGHKIHVFYP